MMKKATYLLICFGQRKKEIAVKPDRKQSTDVCKVQDYLVIVHAKDSL